MLWASRSARVPLWASAASRLLWASTCVPSASPRPGVGVPRVPVWVSCGCPPRPFRVPVSKGALPFLWASHVRVPYTSRARPVGNPAHMHH